MFFFDDLRVPLNEYVVTETTLGTQTLSTKICPKFARFEAENFHFEVQNTEPEKGSTVVRVSSSANDLPEGIETRIEESLRYVTLAPVRWCIFEKKVKDTLEVAIVPMSEKQTLFFSEPLDHRRPDCANDFWRLFVAYFQHVVNHSEPKCYHPLSAQLFHVISGEARQLTLVGLLVSVAVEGVLNCEYADLAKPSDTFKASLSQVDTLIQRLKCADATLSARLRGALSPMKSSSTSDKLKALEANGIVTKDMVKTWKKLRNTTAHAAVRPDPKALQGMFEQCNVVYTMLNRMIFYAIGYSGNYQDFATPGWPIGKFLVPPAPVV